MRLEVGELLLELEDVAHNLLMDNERLNLAMTMESARLCGAIILLATEVSECREELAAIRVRL